MSDTRRHGIPAALKGAWSPTGTPGAHAGSANPRAGSSVWRDRRAPVAEAREDPDPVCGVGDHEVPGEARGVAAGHLGPRAEAPDEDHQLEVLPLREPLAAGDPAREVLEPGVGPGGLPAPVGPLPVVEEGEEDGPLERLAAQQRHHPLHRRHRRGRGVGAGPLAVRVEVRTDQHRARSAAREHPDEVPPGGGLSPVVVLHEAQARRVERRAQVRLQVLLPGRVARRPPSHLVTLEDDAVAQGPGERVPRFQLGDGAAPPRGLQPHGVHHSGRAQAERDRQGDEGARPPPPLPVPLLHRPSCRPAGRAA